MFSGSTYQPEHDKKRLTNQLERVRDLMLDGEWRSLSLICAIVGGSEAGISARLRDLRKERFGSFVVNRRRFGDQPKGLWQYQVLRIIKAVEYESNGWAAFL